MHHHLIPFLYLQGKLFLRRDIRIRGDVPRIQIPVFLLSERDERRLHPRQNIDHPALVNVP